MSSNVELVQNLNRRLFKGRLSTDVNLRAHAIPACGPGVEDAKLVMVNTGQWISLAPIILGRKQKEEKKPKRLVLK